MGQGDEGGRKDMGKGRGGREDRERRVVARGAGWLCGWTPRRTCGASRELVEVTRTIPKMKVKERWAALTFGPLWGQ